jgi:hypothetical protein
MELCRSGREIKMLIDAADPFATAKPDARLIKLRSERAGSTPHSTAATVCRLLH